MIWIARVLGLTFIVFGGLAAFFALYGAGQGFSVPVWNEQAWTADARRGAEWAVAIALALGGLLMLFGVRAARLLFLLALAVAAARTGYDIALGDPETARYAVMLRGDLVAAAVSAVALVASVVLLRGKTPNS
jgi:hypothetical protein